MLKGITVLLGSEFVRLCAVLEDLAGRGACLKEEPTYREDPRGEEGS